MAKKKPSCTQTLPKQSKKIQKRLPQQRNSSQQNQNSNPPSSYSSQQNSESASRSYQNQANHQPFRSLDQFESYSSRYGPLVKQQNLNEYYEEEFQDNRMITIERNKFLELLNNMGQCIDALKESIERAPLNRLNLEHKMSSEISRYRAKRERIKLQTYSDNNYLIKKENEVQFLYAVQPSDDFQDYHENEAKLQAKQQAEGEYENQNQMEDVGAVLEQYIQEEHDLKKEEEPIKAQRKNEHFEEEQIQNIQNEQQQLSEEEKQGSNAQEKHQQVNLICYPEQKNEPEQVPCPQQPHQLLLKNEQKESVPEMSEEQKKVEQQQPQQHQQNQQIQEQLQQPLHEENIERIEEEPIKQEGVKEKIEIKYESIPQVQEQ